MLKTARCVEVKDGEGKTLLSFCLYDKEVVTDDGADNSSGRKQEVKDNKGQADSHRSDGDLMTDAQKRYLFRILADRGIEEDKAHERLKDLLHVDSLKEVTKVEASKMIERLLEEAKGGEGDGPPF